MLTRKNPTLLTPTVIDDMFSDPFSMIASDIRGLMRDLPTINSATVCDKRISYEQKDNKHLVTFEVPGYSKEDLEVTYDGEILSVKGKKEERKLNFALSIPEMNSETVVAECKNGLLHVTLEKSKVNNVKVIKIK